MPLNFFNAVRVVPYVQGQLVGWTDQLGGGPLGHRPRARWGGPGAAWAAGSNVALEEVSETSGARSSTSTA